MNAARRPLNVMFLQTSMPVGGAEVLLVNLVRKLDRARFSPEIVCLKEPGPLGEQMASELPLHSRLIHHKFDVQVLPRLARLMRRRRADAVVTVGAGDKMFWGRLAARAARVPVVASALHSTGWPDGVGRLNRWLTPLTDAFIAVAEPHGAHLVRHEGFPEQKVHVIPNGVDTARFAPLPNRAEVRRMLGVSPAAPLVAILAALRPEKNHELFLQAAASVQRKAPETRFLVIGDGPRRAELEQLSRQLGLAESVSFLGSRSDVPQLLASIDVLALTSHNEANPVSILEAMSCAKPVVATSVGSVGQTVLPGQTGFLTQPGQAQDTADRLLELIDDPLKAQQMGRQARRLIVQNWSLEGMVGGYETLLEDLYRKKTGAANADQPATQALEETLTASHS